MLTPAIRPKHALVLYSSQAALPAAPLAQNRMAVHSPGTSIGRYEIEALVGQGGMGVVYRALDPALDRRVALKLLAAHLLGNPQAMARFRREATAVANLKHPNIATVFEFGEHQGQPFIAAEWIEGQTLTQLLTLQGPLPLTRALLLFDQLASALDYAHAYGVIHRDIKPSNIIVRADDHPTIVDFGLAWADTASSITATGSIFGTPHYMAPEQIEGKKVDGRADLYALACVLYEMLAGRPPFDDKSTPAILHKQLYEPPPPIRELNPRLPARVETVLAKALSKKPEDRFADAQSFGAALRAAASSSSVRPRRVFAALGLFTCLCLCLSTALAGALAAVVAIPSAPPTLPVAGFSTTDIIIYYVPTATLKPTASPLPTQSPVPAPSPVPAVSPTPLPQPTATATPEYHNIVNVRNGLCLSVATNPESSGAAVVQDACTDENNVKWAIVPVRDQDSQIRLLASGMCMDIDGSAAENDGIIQRDCDPARETQLWQLRSYGSNFEIVGVHGGLCVEVPAFQTGRLIQMTYYGCNPNKLDNGNQRWLSK